jgi:hypothetical protein
MAIKLALMKTGEYVISDVKEIINAEENPCGYMLNYPHQIKWINSSVVLVEQQIDSKIENTEKDIEVTLSPWIMLSKDSAIPVALDSVIAIVNPLKTLEELFQEKLALNGSSIEK